MYWQKLGSPMITPDLSLGKWLPKEADNSHREYRDGYVWHWTNPQGWLFKNGPLQSRWSNLYSYDEAPRIIRERVSLTVGIKNHTDILVVHALSPHQEVPFMAIALFRVTSGALRGFDTTPPDWYAPTSRSRLDLLSEPIV
jgi:hypothetical protein